MSIKRQNLEDRLTAQYYSQLRAESRQNWRECERGKVWKPPEYKPYADLYCGYVRCGGSYDTRMGVIRKDGTVEEFGGVEMIGVVRDGIFYENGEMNG